MTRAELLALAARKLWPRVIPEPNSGCWLWEGAAHPQGYGQVWSPLDRRLLSSHRLSYMVCVGEIPDEMLVCHRCDNPPCCNPEHLFLGTIKDNAVDMMRKKRHPICHDQAMRKRLQVAGGRATGGKNFRINGVNATAKVTPDQVRQIRADTRSARIVGAEYGLSLQAVSSIRRGHTWKHIT